MKKIIILTTLIFSVILLYLAHVSYLYFDMMPFNEKALSIKTFDGLNCPYHPAVIYAKEGWSGYKYWMAETPYSPQAKPYRDKNECPSIHYSNDGINWEEKHNPIDSLSCEDIKNLDYFSDPHLVMRNDTIECWYRITRRHKDVDRRKDVYLLRKKSADGLNWTEREVLVSCAQDTSCLGKMVVSPAVIYKDSLYQMWYVNSEGDTRGISFAMSQNGKIWEGKTDCNIYGQERQPWHIDVTFIDGQYYLTIYDFEDITIYRSHDKHNFYKIKTSLTPSKIGSYYGCGLYRACLIKDEQYKLYFSADDGFNTYIGLMAGDKIECMNVVDNGKHATFWDLLSYKFKLDKVRYTFIIKHALCKFIKI